MGPFEVDNPGADFCFGDFLDEGLRLRLMSGYSYPRQ